MKTTLMQPSRLNLENGPRPKKMPRNPSLPSIDIWIKSHKVLEFTNFNWPLGHFEFTFTWSMNDSFREEPIQIRKAHGHSKCVEILNGCIKLHVCIYSYVCKINEYVSTCTVSTVQTYVIQLNSLSLASRSQKGLHS